MKRSMLGAACLLVLTACSRTQAPDIQADKQSLATVICAPDWNLGANELETSLSTYFSDDTIIYWPNSQPRRSNDVLMFAKGWVTDANYAFKGTTTNLDVAASGDLAYCSGTYSAQSTDPRTRTVLVDTGYWETVFRKRNGSWKAVTDIHAPDHP